MEEDEEIEKNISEMITNGYELIEKLSKQVGVEGIGKLSRKIKREVEFLEKVRSMNAMKKEHLQSTNLIHLTALVERLLSSENPTEVLKQFKLLNSRLAIDIVCNGGATWIKVIARNARALTLISLGNGEYGQKSILDQAEQHLECSKLHPYYYKSPKVVFHFAYGIETVLASKLEELGVFVEGERIQNGEEVCSNTSEDCDDEFAKEFKIIEGISSSSIQALNLDVSTLLAYVSNMTNGYANFEYTEPLLTLQAQWEREQPLKPFLDQLFEGKLLQVCKTAYDNFMDIINLIGGPMERERTRQLAERVQVVDDVLEGRIARLSIGGKIKTRSQVVFGTGEFNKSVTVSANEGFVRAARMQGIECTAILHQPRSLSERKEKSATSITL